jgi:hypothetical protein
LTKYIKGEIDKETTLAEGTTKSPAEAYSKLINEVVATGKSNPNIEDILSFLRRMMQVSKGAADVRGFSESELIMLEKLVCKKNCREIGC